MKDLIFLAQGAQPFVVGFEGNISKKTSNGFIIKASGTPLSSPKEENFVEYDFNLRQVNNFTKKGSMEREFHDMIYSVLDCNYICHTHPTNLLKILCSESIYTFGTKRLFPDQVIFNGPKSCIVDYAHPGINLSKVIYDSLLDFISANKFKPEIILLKNHGLITFGSTPEECIMKTEICEKSAEIFLGSLLTGFPSYLSSRDIKNLINDKREKLRKNAV